MLRTRRGAHVSPEPPDPSRRRPRPQGRHKRQGTGLFGRASRDAAREHAAVEGAAVEGSAVEGGDPAPVEEVAVPVEEGPDRSPEATGALSHRTVTTTRRVPFRRVTVEDPALEVGTTRLRTCGIAGTERLVWSETWRDGVRESRRLLGRQAVQPPVTEVRLVGSRVAGPLAAAPAHYRGGMPIAVAG